MSPEISVIIPAYNREQTIQRAIKSVLEQTYQNYEIIVVDDGSRDNTVHIVEQMAMSDPRIRLIKLPKNMGAMAARNVGIRSAQGKWIAFLDSDDMYLPRSLELRLAKVNDEHLKVVHSECYVIRPNDIDMSYFEVPPIQGISSYKQLLQKPGPMFQALLISRDAIEKIGYLDETIIAYQEWDTAIRLSMSYEFGYVPEPTFVYDCRTPGTISKQLLKGAKGYSQIIKKHRKAILKNLGPRRLSNHYIVNARQYYQAGSKVKSLFLMLEGLILWPPNVVLLPKLIVSKMYRKIFR